MTVGLGLLQGTGYYFYLRASNFEGTNVVKYTEGGAQVFSAIVIILTFTAGTALLMWLGDKLINVVLETVFLLSCSQVS